MTAPSRDSVDRNDPGLRPPVLTPEEAYVGALMWLDGPVAMQAAWWLTTEDIASPAAGLVHRLVQQLCHAGIPPDPASVLALAIKNDTVTGPQRIRDLTLTLARLFDHRSSIPPAIRWYACAALDQAIRRRTVEMATRLRQVAGHADPDELERLTQSEQQAINVLRARLRRLSEARDEAAAA